MSNHKWKAAVLFVTAVAGLAVAQESKEKLVPVRPHVAFDRLKALVGEWEGTNSQGQPARISYQLVSNGTVLLETLASKEPSGKAVDMVTTYYLDGNKIMLTHYCAGNTQPRMVAASPAENEFHFTRKDVTNLPGPQWGAMRALKLTLVSKNEISQAWTWHQDGKDFSPETFQFERKH